MDKEEIIKQIDVLKFKVKKPGRAFTKIQREKMREEISFLEDELQKVIIEEDILFYNEFKQKYPSYLMPEIDDLNERYNKMIEELTDLNTKLILENRIKRFTKEFYYLKNTRNEIDELNQILNDLNKEKKVSFMHQYHNMTKEQIQRQLGVKIRRIESQYIQLKDMFEHMQNVIYFIQSDNKISAFVYLSDAIFTKASDFENGYGTVLNENNMMYFSFEGKKYDSHTSINKTPRYKKVRENPDLIPFKKRINNFNYVYGYKDSNGNVIIPAKYKSASAFINGFAKVAMLKEGYKNYTYGLIEQTGRIILPLDYLGLNDVCNDVVVFKQHTYKDEMKQMWNFDWKQVTRYLGLLSGYCIYTDIKQEIYRQIDKIKENENIIAESKINNQVQHSYDEIKISKEWIDLYTNYITAQEVN